MTVEQIIDFFCIENGVKSADVMSGVKSLSVWTTRYMIWLYLHTKHSFSANKLSKIFNRNRPSIFRGIRIIKHDMKIYKDMRSKYESIVKKIEDA